MKKKLTVALVGLSFGGFFSEIYKLHPDVERVVLFDTDKKREENLCKRLGIEEHYDTYEDILSDPDIDAVHLVTPFTMHEKQTIAALEAGKHCACTVPMGLTLEGLKKICELTEKTGKNYMMMETTLYTYQYFYAQQMKEKEEFGKIQFLRGCHYQDMTKWPDYWIGLPPMYYSTHAMSPITMMAGSRIKSVNCFGSGTLNPEYQKQYKNPYPVETAVLTYENGLKAEVTRSLFETAREYIEGFHVYGSKKTFEFGDLDSAKPTVTSLIPPIEGNRGGTSETVEIELPGYAENLPESIQKYAIQGGDFDPLNPHKSWGENWGAGHHGSHPHLVHEFVRSIIEERKPLIDEKFGANITATGILAHESAMQDGKKMEIPLF
ncbi:MAG: Gfo/Idh/MocA family oxidoreductase [Lachnospiraceae bacterium]|nr:Gfo/Idh/MocA family oxidoreductase [Lachnospiraceae bacterium]